MRSTAALIALLLPTAPGLLANDQWRDPLYEKPCSSRLSASLQPSGRLDPRLFPSSRGLIAGIKPGSGRGAPGRCLPGESWCTRA